MKSTSQMFFCGCTTFKTDPVEVDLSLSDEAVFEACCHHMAVLWSSTGGQPHFKAAMMKDGSVKRSAGRTLVSGAGWLVAFETPELEAERKAIIEAKDWPKLVELSERWDSVSTFNASQA